MPAEHGVLVRLYGPRRSTRRDENIADAMIARYMLAESVFSAREALGLRGDAYAPCLRGVTFPTVLGKPYPWGREYAAIDLQG